MKIHDVTCAPLYIIESQSRMQREIQREIATRDTNGYETAN